MKDDEIPPKIHDLEKLAKRANLYDKMTEKQIFFLLRLIPLQIEARYENYKSSIAKTLNNEIVTDLYKSAKEMLEWVKQQLKK